MGLRDVKRGGPRSSVTTLINSSVGVVALAMPYCFKQCGIILSTVFILFSAVSCILACDLLIDLCLSHRVSSLEKTCFRHLGILGKLVAELSIIGLMVGSIIGYNVSLADLGADIVLKICQTLPSQHLRLIVLVFLTALIAPLCLMSKVQSFAKMCTCAMFFYSFMVVHMIFALGVPKIVYDFPLQHTIWWRTAGLIQCAPIFFASIFCQTQLHTIYAGLHQPSVREMRQVVRLAVVILTIAYGLFGFFGYVAFADVNEVPGNVFLMYPENLLTFCVKAGFLFTVSISIPLTMFPLRQSIESFFFHRGPFLTSDLDFASDGLQPPTRRFRSTTICLIILCFFLSLTTDKIVLIIQLTSSLAGSLIGYILPALAAMYAFAHHRGSKERRIGGCLLFVGIFVLVIGLISVHQIQPPAPSVPASIKDSVIGAVDVHHALKAAVGAIVNEERQDFAILSAGKRARLGGPKTPTPDTLSTVVQHKLSAELTVNKLAREDKGVISGTQHPRFHATPTKPMHMNHNVFSPPGSLSDPSVKLGETSNERRSLSQSDSTTRQDHHRPSPSVLTPRSHLVDATVAIGLIKPPTELDIQAQPVTNQPVRGVLAGVTESHYPNTIAQAPFHPLVDDTTVKNAPPNIPSFNAAKAIHEEHVREPSNGVLGSQLSFLPVTGNSSTNQSTGVLPKN